MAVFFPDRTVFAGAAFFGFVAREGGFFAAAFGFVAALVGAFFALAVSLGAASFGFVAAFSGAFFSRFLGRLASSAVTTTAMGFVLAVLFGCEAACVLIEVIARRFKCAANASTPRSSHTRVNPAQPFAMKLTNVGQPASNASITSRISAAYSSGSSSRLTSGCPNAMQTRSS